MAEATTIVRSERREPANSRNQKPVVPTVDPSTGQPGRIYEGHTLDEAQLMKAAAGVLLRRQDAFAELMTAEMGKTLKEGRAEIEKCAFACDYFAAHAEQYLASQPIELGGPKTFVAFNPLGVVLAVMPWNFPFWQVFRFAAPALMAGNAAVLKHASNVPGCALAVESVFREAGFPENLFRTALVRAATFAL